MGRKHPNPRSVKIHRSYAVEEAAEVLGVHKNTCRNWLRQGLTPIDDHHPILISGRTLREFLSSRREKSKSPCPPGHLYCFRCRAPKRPAGNMADYVPKNLRVGALVAICADCDAWMRRIVRADLLSEFTRYLDIMIAPAPPRIEGSSSHSVNCAFENRVKEDDKN
jgi:hypothetical protein